MRSVPTGHPKEFTYGAPPGLEGEIGGLPCTREEVRYGERVSTAIFSVWELSDAERKAIAEGANLRLGIYGMEPIPPVSLAVTNGKRAGA